MIGLVRQYPAKGTHLLVYIQATVDGIVYQINNRPRKGWVYDPNGCAQRSVAQQLTTFNAHWLTNVA
jgi:IS30 family transposase